MKKLLSVAGLFMLFVAGPLWAQGTEIEIGVLGGLYLPVSDLVEADDPEGIGADLSHAAAAAFGARLTLWLTEVFGVEGGFAYALSDVEIEVDGEDQCVGDVCDANAWLANVKGLYRFMAQPDANWGLHFGAGLGLIGRGGDFWDQVDVDGTTDIGGVLNAGLTVDVTPNIAIRVDVEDYLYSAKFNDPESDAETESKFQNDLLFLGGLSFKVGGGM